MYDINLFPIDPNKENLPQSASGFLAFSPPRRATRSRAEDMLIMSVFARGKDQAAVEKVDGWLAQIAHSFYKMSGSVTSALRSLIDSLNLSLLDNNLKLAREGGTIIAAANLAAVHRRSLLIVQSGVMHTYTMTHEGLQHFTDSSRSDRGLGLSRTPSVRYYQADLGTGGYLFMADSPPNTWTETLLLADGFPSLERLRRRLLNQASPDLRLDLVQIVPGDGQIKVFEAISQLKSQPVADQSADVHEGMEPAILEQTFNPVEADEELGGKFPFEETADSETQKVKINTGEEPLEIAEDLTLSLAGEIFISEATESENAEAPLKIDTDVADAMQPEDSAKSQPMIVTGSPVIPVESVLDSSSKKNSRQDARKSYIQQRERMKNEGLKGLVSFFDGWHAFREKISNSFHRVFARFSPAEDGDSGQISQGKLLMIALLTPLVVVIIATSIYMIRGRTLQQKFYYDQAQSFAASAKSAEGLVEARDLWTEALVNLDQSEAFRKSDETTALRTEIQDALDRLDGAIRLDYRPAIVGELHSGMNIIRIVSYGMDLYLLDSESGSVIHATGGRQGYTRDADFLCAPGNYSGGSIDLFVDMVAMPINNPYQAHILAADALGNVVYCSPGQNPVVQSLPQSAGGPFEVNKITFGNNSLHVLDGTANIIHVFSATNGQFLEPPVNYFGNAKPEEIPDISKVVDLAINGPELYLLRANGKIVNCVYSGLPANPVTCEIPVKYVDGRPGKEDQEVMMPEGEYISLIYTTPPDPSVSVLDAAHADIYRFSLRFRLHQRMRPDLENYEVSSHRATAFTIGIDQIAFIAFGNQVFYAYVD